jgi:hypothetical protein
VNIHVKGFRIGENLLEQIPVHARYAPNRRVSRLKRELLAAYRGDDDALHRREALECPGH